MLLDYKWPHHEYSDEEEKASQNAFKIDNVSVSELQSILMIDCNLAVRLVESKYLKMIKTIQIIEL